MNYEVYPSSFSRYSAIKTNVCTLEKLESDESTNKPRPGQKAGVGVGPSENPLEKKMRQPIPVIRVNSNTYISTIFFGVTGRN